MKVCLIRGNGRIADGVGGGLGTGLPFVRGLRCVGCVGLVRCLIEVTYYLYWVCLKCLMCTTELAVSFVVPIMFFRECIILP